MREADFYAVIYLVISLGCMSKEHQFGGVHYLVITTFLDNLAFDTLCVFECFSHKPLRCAMIEMCYLGSIKWLAEKVFRIKVEQ